MADKDTKDTKNALETTKFKSEGDFINQLLTKHCSDIVDAVAPVKEVKDKDGKVTTPGVRGKKGKSVVKLDELKALAQANGFDLSGKDYPNPGMWRMNVGNMLRAAAKKRGGLYVGEKWTKAPEDFPCHDPLTEKRDGTKIVAKKAKDDAKAA